MRQKSTERSRITLPDDVIAKLALSADYLKSVRLVDHTLGESLAVAMQFCSSSMSTHMKILLRFYVVGNEPKSSIKITKDLKDKIQVEARTLGVTKQAYIHTVTTLFITAILGKLHKGSPSQLPGEGRHDFVFSKKINVLDLPGVRKPRLQTRKLHLKREEAAMRHHKYVDEFRTYMESYGGLDSLMNKNVSVPIHAHSIAGNIGHPHETDRPIEVNPGRPHVVRIWKRGRGYNMTVLQSGPAHNDDAPSLEVGSVWRLYDIYRNIDWTNITNA